MLSSQGKATAAPTPRNIPRREMAFLVMIMACSLFFCCQNRLVAGYAHTKRRAVHDSQDHGRPAIVLRGRVARNPADGGVVGRFDPAAHGISQEFFAKRANEI